MKFKRNFIVTVIVILCLSIFIFINFTGCGAIAAIVSAVFGSQGGFVFVPFLSEKEMQGLNGAPVPGMIVLNQNKTDFPGINYKPLSGVTVSIEGSNVTAVTDENGHYTIGNLSEGTPNLIAQKDGYLTYTEQVVVTLPDTAGTINTFFVSPTNIHLISGRSYQFIAYGETSGGHLLIPSTTWNVEKVEEYINGIFTEIQNNNNGIVDTNGVFTGITPGANPLKITLSATSGSFTSTSEITITPGAGSLSGKVTDTGGNSVFGARVGVASTPYFTTTDSNGNYSLPEVPANFVVTVVAQSGEQTASSVFGVSPGESAVLNLVLGGSAPAGFTYQGTLGVTGILGSDNSHFNQPATIVFDSQGNFYVVDTENHRVQKFSSGNTYLATIGTGSPVSNNVGFNSPQGIGIDGSGNVYVADLLNHRVQKFSSSGNYLQTFGATGVEGSDNSHFSYPVDVAIDSNGNIYVCDSGNHRVQKLSSSGSYLMTIGVTGVPGYDNSHFGENLGPAYIGIDKNNNIYISDSNPSNRVQVFDSSGTYIATMGETGFTSTDNSHFYGPNDIAFDASGNIFVVDHFNHRVQMFNSNRVYVDTIGISGSPGSTNTTLDCPTGVGVSPVGRIYVGDLLNHRVQIFSR